MFSIFAIVVRSGAVKFSLLARIDKSGVFSHINSPLSANEASHSVSLLVQLSTGNPGYMSIVAPNLSPSRTSNVPAVPVSNSLLNG